MTAPPRQPRPGSETVPKVSVIVPIYGTEAYVEACLRSVMEQTLREIEIICVDDASPDDSAAIVARLAAQDERIRLIRHPRNRGLGGARNSGIEAARAPYVTGVDSDDYILPETMEKLWEGTGGGVADVVVCGLTLVSAAGEPLKRISPKAQQLRNDRDQIDIFSVFNPSFCNKLWRRSLFTDHAIRFPERCYYEDLATSPRLLRFAADLRVIPDNLYRYVQRATSITKTTSAQHITDYFRVYDLLRDFLEAEGLLERYREAFRDIIGKTLSHHAGNVMASALSEAEKRQYLRILLILKLSYLEHDDLLHDLDADRLQALMPEAVSRQDLQR